MSFTIETVENNKVPFFDLGKFATNVYRKPTFSGAYTHFDSFLPNIYKISMIDTLLNRCFWICSKWSMLHSHF